MFGLIGKMVTTPGKRDEFAAILLGGTGGMPGCLSYIVAKDPRDADALWITEVWDSAESHKASLKLPGVQAAIAKGRPLIASFGDQVQTEPIGGIGLSVKALSARSSVNDQVRRHNPLIEREHVRVGRIDGDVQPVIVVLTEGLDPGEILEAAPARGPEERLVDAKIM